MVLAGRLCSKFLRSTINLSARRLHEVKYISVRDFYRNKNIFITGATGFLGQGLVENLLRSCPDLGNIYLPIRATKKGDTTRRYKKFLNNTVFDSLRSADSNFAAKLVLLSVVLEEPNLGLSEEMYERLTNDVSVIFHEAALIKFNPALNLYTHIDLDLVEEKVYPTTWNHDQLIELDKRELQRKEKAIVGSCSGTYFATKKVAENLTKLEKGLCPVAIFRPGKVSPSVQYPEPGWSYGYASYIPWMFMVEKGDVRHHMGVPEHKEELIPIDLCANSLLSTAWYIGTRPHRARYSVDPFVVHINSSQEKYVTTPDVVESYNSQTSILMAKNVRNRCMSSYVIQPRDISPDQPSCHGEQLYTRRGEDIQSPLSSSKLWLIMAVGVRTVYQTTIAFIKGEKPLSLLLYAFVFTDKGINAIQMTNNPKEYKNFDKIERALSVPDKRDFSADVTDLNWEEYIRTWLRALKSKREVRETRAQQAAERVQTTKM